MANNTCKKCSGLENHFSPSLGQLKELVIANYDKIWKNMQHSCISHQGQEKAEDETAYG